MDFKILDASAFYAGVPFRSSDRYCTTPLVYNEIKHIKKNHDALGTLLETGKLEIIEPGVQATENAVAVSKKTGDYLQLSKEDISIIALGMEMKRDVITDDFAVVNVIKNSGLKVSCIMTEGIRDVGRWVHYCPGCRTSQGARVADNHNHHSNKNKNSHRCPVCDTPLKRKLIKKRTLSAPLHK